MKFLVLRLRELLWVEQALAADVLPRLRDRAHATDVRRALDRHLLETEGHVANVRRALTLLGEPDIPAESALLETAAGDDLAILDAIVRTEHAEVGSYAVLVHLALALGVDGEVVHLLRLNKEQDAYAAEEAEYALAKLLSEKVAS